eukprot:6471418-Amphidinium_carterae.1
MVVLGTQANTKVRMAPGVQPTLQSSQKIGYVSCVTSPMISWEWHKWPRRRGGEPLALGRDLRTSERVVTRHTNSGELTAHLFLTLIGQTDCQIFDPSRIRFIRSHFGSRRRLPGS